MRLFWAAFFWLLALVLQVPPDAARSNLALWIGLVTDASLPAWAISSSADRWVGAMGMTAGVIIAAWPFLVRRRKPVESAPPAAEPEASPVPVMVERDVWLADALNYIAFGSWSERDKWHGEDVAEGEATRILSGLYAAEKLVAQAAFDDKLPIWGRQDEHSLFEQVPAAYWKHYRLDWPTMLEAPSGFAHYPRVAMCHRVVWKGS